MTIWLIVIIFVVCMYSECVYRFNPNTLNTHYDLFRQHIGLGCLLFEPE